jgi:hypothetical protein
MSDARDAVAEALALNRRLAATLLVRKQELEAELAAGPPTDRAALAAAELADVDGEYRSALAEIAQLRVLGEQARGDAARVAVAGAPAGDPVSATDEERALAAARAYILELDAQASLGAGPAEQPAPATAAKRHEEADREARAEFEALRARRTGEPAPEPGPARRPKKTL